MIQIAVLGGFFEIFIGFELAYVFSKLGRDGFGFTQVLLYLTWCIGVLCVCIAAPVLIYATSNIFFNSAFDWYEFGNEISAIYIAFAMIAGVIAPIVMMVRWYLKWYTTPNNSAKTSVKMSNVGKTTIQKLSAGLLIFLAAFLQYGFWTALNGDNNFAAQTLLHSVPGNVDPFIFLTIATFLGFTVFWTILLIQRTVEAGLPMVMLAVLILALAFSLVVIPGGTSKGWSWMGNTNTMVFGINSFMAFLYIIFGKVSN